MIKRRRLNSFFNCDFKETTIESVGGQNITQKNRNLPLLLLIEYETIDEVLKKIFEKDDKNTISFFKSTLQLLFYPFYYMNI